MATREEVEERSDGTVVVEAPSVEAALEAVERRFGPNATIIDAERLNTRGVGGFFSKQSYRVTVKADATPAAPTQMAQAATAVASDLASMPDDSGISDELAAVDHVLEQIEQGDSDDGRTFGDVLRAQLQNRPKQPAPAPAPEATATSMAPEPVIDLRDSVMVPAMSWADVVDSTPVSSGAVAAPAREVGAAAADAVPITSQATRAPLARPAEGCPAGTGRVMWSVDSLSRLGVPYRLIAPLGDLDPDDELAWVYRFAEAAAPLCGPLPASGSVLVGRAAVRLAESLGFGVFATNEVPPFEGDLAVAGDFDAAAFDYVQRIAAGREVHLVVDDGPLSVRGAISVVSWADTSVCEAMHVAISTGSTLGFHIDGESVTRVTPFELALAVRALLPRE
ncbi:MAG: hypothetical protein KDB16_03660 [Acidimicrobiales bacterium]|nr:hypothetical protein [Acidimicrobiales bacterium]